MLPMMRGAGPIAWYQATAALRSMGGIIIVLGVMLGSLGLMFFIMIRNHEALYSMLGVAWGVTFFLLPLQLQFDFRGDIDRMDLLKTLPCSPYVIAAGEMLAPVCAMSAVHLILGLGMLAAGYSHPEFVLVGLLFVVPVNFIVIAMENLAFLLFPVRMTVGEAPGPQVAMRQMMMMFVKTIFVLMLTGFAALMGLVAHKLTGQIAVGIVVAWLVVVAFSAGLLPVLGWAFARFDPSVLVD